MKSISFVLGIFAMSSLSLAAEISHPSMRPLPTASARPLVDTKSYFVDVNHGDDNSDGSLDRPWKTLAHAVAQLSPGDTLCLRSGIWFERIAINVRGTSKRPITIRSFPGEMVVIDGGLPEFIESSATAWEPVSSGAEHEFRSTRAYPQLEAIDGRTSLLGNFADSMIPLHGYRFLTDLRSENHSFHKLKGSKTAQGNGLYCGPGVFLNPKTHRIHVRLAHTRQPSIGEANNYRGPTDPRSVPMTIAGIGRTSPLELIRSSHVILQDIVVRGSRDATINIQRSSNITLDGVTSYGGSSALRIERTQGLRCVDCAFRGIAAPWLWRWSLKYRSIEARIVSASQWNPPAIGNRDFEFAYCEFTDCVDGVFIGNVDGVSIHHCLLDNISDDGIFITCRTAYDGSTPGGDFKIHQNRISRVLTAVAFGVGHGRQKTINDVGDKQLGKTTVIRNNVFDLRKPVLYQQPITGPITTFGRVAGDHGSPAWEPIEFLKNTVYYKNSPWRNYYAAGLGKGMGRGTKRTIVGNLFIHELGQPGEVLPQQEVMLHASANQHWSTEAGDSLRDTFLKRFRSSPIYANTKWTSADRYAPPNQATSDTGAGADTAVGIRGRMTLYGKGDVLDRNNATTADWPKSSQGQSSRRSRVAMVLGYPAFDAPLLQFAFEKVGSEVVVFDKQWLPAKQFAMFDAVVFLGNTVRAKMSPSGFSAEEIPLLRKYLDNGGTLVVGRELFRYLFPTDELRKPLIEWLGTCPRRVKPQISILKEEHPWIKHFNAGTLNKYASGNWLSHDSNSPICLGKGNNLIGDLDTSRSILADAPIGKGRLIYVGWELSRMLPHGRLPSTPAAEAEYEKHYKVYEQMAAELSR